MFFKALEDRDQKPGCIKTLNGLNNNNETIHQIHGKHPLQNAG